MVNSTGVLSLGHLPSIDDRLNAGESMDEIDASFESTQQLHILLDELGGPNPQKEERVLDVLNNGRFRIISIALQAAIILALTAGKYFGYFGPLDENGKIILDPDYARPAVVQEKTWDYNIEFWREQDGSDYLLKAVIEGETFLYRSQDMGVADKRTIGAFDTLDMAVRRKLGDGLWHEFFYDELHGAAVNPGERMLNFVPAVFGEDELANNPSYKLRRTYGYDHPLFGVRETTPESRPVKPLLDILE